VADENVAKTLLKLLDTLEDNDDVQRVSANFEIPDDIMEKLGLRNRVQVATLALKEDHKRH